MRKAGNLVEMPIIVGVVTVVAIGTLIVYNNQNLRLAVMSAINFRPVNLQTMTQDTAKQIVPYNRVETAGGSALTNIAMTSSDFDSAITHTTYAEVKKALDETDSQGKNIANYANDLKGPLGLKFDDITETNITSQTLSDLVKVLNAISSKTFKDDHPDQIANAKGFLERFKSVLTSALSNIASTTVSANTNSSIGQTETAGKNGLPANYVAETGGGNVINDAIQSGSTTALNSTTSSNSRNLEVAGNAGQARPDSQSIEVAGNEGQMNPDGGLATRPIGSSTTGVEYTGGSYSSSSGKFIPNSGPAVEVAGKASTPSGSTKPVLTDDDGYVVVTTNKGTITTPTTPTTPTTASKKPREALNKPPTETAW